MYIETPARSAHQGAFRVRRANPITEVVVTQAGAAEVAAEMAVKQSDWLLASQLYEKAAELQPENPHGATTANEMRLRLQAHVTRTMYLRLQRLGLERAFIKRGQA
jgi:hypothetical protein